jgi:hypothetical protein
MYHKNPESVNCAIMTDITDLIVNEVYGTHVIRQLSAFVIRLTKMAKCQIIRQTFDAGKRSFHVRIIRMSSGRYEYMGHDCSDK